MCGIFGIVSSSKFNVSPYIIDALSYLQHRGQDAVGVVTCDDDGQLFFQKKQGTIQQSFNTPEIVNSLEGHYGIGHLRYPTSGAYSYKEQQPFYVNSPYGICLAHNGNLTNADSLKKELFDVDRRHINSLSDSEVLLNVFAHAFQTTKDIEKSIKIVYERCQGAYSVVLLIVGIGLIAFRDKNGIRPLIIGSRYDDNGNIMHGVSSESAALSSLGFDSMADLPAGSMCFIDISTNTISVKKLVEDTFTPCAFEYVYLARPDSILDGVSVYRTRRRLGKFLANTIQKDYAHLDIDVAVPIPDTSVPTTLALAEQLNIKYREGLVKNRYVGRTFIMKDQKSRQNSIKRKFNVLDIEVIGKNVLLVDDSIVRGNTSLQIVNMLREAGANQVYFASAAPMITHQNVYGIDMPIKDELLVNRANSLKVPISELINVDEIIYQPLDSLRESIMMGNHKITQIEDSVFTGNYVTGISTQDLIRIEESRK